MTSTSRRKWTPTSSFRSWRSPASTRWSGWRTASTWWWTCWEVSRRAPPHSDTLRRTPTRSVARVHADMPHRTPTCSVTRVHADMPRRMPSRSVACRHAPSHTDTPRRTPTRPADRCDACPQSRPTSKWTSRARRFVRCTNGASSSCERFRRTRRSRSVPTLVTMRT